jgi:hypothetical protein
VVGADARPTITFSRPVVAAHVRRGAEGALSPRVAEPGVAREMWRWIGSASVEFVPKDAAALRHPVHRHRSRRPQGRGRLLAAARPSAGPSTPRLRSSSRPRRPLSWRWLQPSQDIVLVFNQAVVEPEKVDLGPGGTRGHVLARHRQRRPAPLRPRRWSDRGRTSSRAGARRSP